MNHLTNYQERKWRFPAGAEKKILKILFSVCPQCDMRDKCLISQRSWGLMICCWSAESETITLCTASHSSAWIICMQISIKTVDAFWFLNDLVMSSRQWTFFTSSVYASGFRNEEHRVHPASSIEFWLHKENVFTWRKQDVGADPQRSDSILSPWSGNKRDFCLPLLKEYWTFKWEKA